MNRKRVKTAILLFLIFLVVFFCKSCYNTLSNAEQEIYTSPNETNTIIVQYDILCRPTLYKKTWFGKKKIWDYPGSGFMETVHFGVEWLSEDEIRLSYEDIRHSEYDEEYVITIP
ncbi:MAG: hypothetical protein HFH53_05110 [Hespellia sp.]|jgi:hypothetical protein|nr:hypothetical protein [Hespellia sp.]